MDPIFKKLNFKEQQEVLLINAPESFQTNVEAMRAITSFTNDLDAVDKIEFAMAFVTKKEQIDDLIPRIADKLEGDALIWFCYPKGTSKNYKCDFNRDTGWTIMGKFDLEPVRMVAIDADWSALRFRRVQFIKKITRRESFALTDDAKKRTTQKGK